MLYLLTRDEAVREHADVTAFRNKVIDGIPDTDAVLVQVNHDGTGHQQYRSVADYKRYMRSHRFAWGGGAELLSMCRLFDVCIHVYDAVHASWIVHGHADDHRHLHLYYEDQCHYRPM